LTDKNTEYHLNKRGEFIINNYNSAKLFSSFFPGVAGKDGIPMWVFYVNRGQCICSMGIKDKQHPIMEFLPANWAYNLVSSQGFRTFIKFPENQTINYYEPFQNHLRDKNINRSQSMIISPSELTLQEINHTLGLKFSVKYFNIPNDCYAGLVRKLEIKNQSDEPVSLEALDGLPLIIPCGIDNYGLKFMRRLFEAFVEVTNFHNKVPFFKGKVEPADRPDVVRIKKGNFYLGLIHQGQNTKIVTPLVDPVKIFGIRGDYSYPERFLTEPSENLANGQIFENRLPSAMGLFDTVIQPQETFTYYSIIGNAASAERLNDLVPRISQKKYLLAKEKENREIIKAITQKNFINSSQPVFDHYARQNFLDNVLRGGIPYTIKGDKAQTIVHLYSRKHGDLERDYNDYRLAPTNYSQGNGNFRDVNQNRRSDLFFNPDVQEDNVEHFYNLIQLDGFNPLVIKEKRFAPDDKDETMSYLAKHFPAEAVESITAFLSSSFTPGELLHYLSENDLQLKGDTELFLGNLLAVCQNINDTDYGEGYWTDHWTYNLDLIENFLAVYPEKLRYLLFEKKTFSFYDNPHIVMPRDDKYVIWDGNLMQLNAVAFDKEKDNLILSRTKDHNKVRTAFGKGEVYYTNLMNKILSVIVNKMASLDPAGVGVEMETDKPNWYDALNGLPGLIGSSLSETLEIKRHILFLLDSFQKLKLEDRQWLVYIELADYMRQLLNLLKAKHSAYEYWEKAAAVKEAYRKTTRMGINGEETGLNIKDIKEFLVLCLNKLEHGISLAWNKKQNVINTYFINQVTEYEEIMIKGDNGKDIIKTNARGLKCFRSQKFQQQALPLFLEGPVHYLRCLTDREKARELAANIKNSGLYDKKLKMYKVNESLADQVMEIGRARTFSPGWFENESVWLHMEYKYMLELLRSGLYSEFYADFKNVFVPFFEPEIYGRSILENSSFIVSSANPDPSLHGNGFVARLSGATAEFIHILALMTLGEKPFDLDQNGVLCLKLKPVLPGWLFSNNTQEREVLVDDNPQNIEFPANSFSFMFLGNTLVTYHNPARKDTFGDKPLLPGKWILTEHDGKEYNIEAAHLIGDTAQRVRNRNFKKIDIYLK
jgi:hypothetical protein